MAETDNTTLNAAQVHPVLGRFSLAIGPHIPPFLGTETTKKLHDWECAAERACEEYGEEVEITASPAEVWIAYNAIRVAVNSEVLSRADQIIGMYALNQLPGAMVGDDSIHAAVDVLARIDWIMDVLEEHGINTDDCIPVLRRVRFDASLLMPDRGVIIDKPRTRSTGPTVGEIKAVENAFAKVGLSKEAAHVAVGYVPFVPEKADA